MPNGKAHMAFAVGTGTFLLTNLTNAINMNTIHNTGGLNNILSTLAVNIAGFAIGAAIVDLDSVNSFISNKIPGGKKITKIILMVLIILFLATQTKINNIYSLIIPLIIMTIHISSPHRGAFHSWLGVLIYSIYLYMFLPIIIGSFVYGYVSHLFLDILTKSGLKVFYPSEFKIKGFLKSDGMFNTILIIFGNGLFLFSLFLMFGV
jgi:inner membrane protein